VALAYILKSAVNYLDERSFLAPH